MTFKITPIAVVRSPFKEPSGMPVNVREAKGTPGTVEVFPRYTAGLKDLKGFNRIWVLFWFDRAERGKLIVTPFISKRPRGVFATRAPSRPNPIGMSCVRLRRVQGNVLHVLDVDLLDGTPVLDIKPYQPSDRFTRCTFGWMDKIRGRLARADRRFLGKGRSIKGS